MYQRKVFSIAVASKSLLYIFNSFAILFIPLIVVIWFQIYTAYVVSPFFEFSKTYLKTMLYSFARSFI